MRKLILIVLVLSLITAIPVGCAATKSETTDPAQTPSKPVNNGDIVQSNKNEGITVNKIPYKTIESKIQLKERGFAVEPIKDGYDITVCSGQRPSAGYNITVKYVEDNEGKTNILVEETEPQAGQSAATVITYPSITISIGNNISPDFHVANTQGDIFQQVTPDASAIPMEDTLENHFEVTDSDQIPGWKRLKATVILQGLTENGSTPLANSQLFSYSIHYPGSWSFNDSSVFYDADNKKIAEIPPAVFLMPAEEAVFLANKPDVNFVDELVSQQDLKVNSYPGSKTVLKVGTEAGNWYPHVYRVSDGTHGFSINLYSRVINEADQKLFADIVNTLQFEQ